MNSRIILYLPQWCDGNSNQKLIKQIAELGYENLVLDAHYLLHDMYFKETLQRENLNILGLDASEVLTPEATNHLIQEMHQLDCGYFLQQPLHAQSQLTVNKIAESGIKILQLKPPFYFRTTDVDEETPIILVNALSFLEKPLQSNKVFEKLEEINFIDIYRNKSVYFLVQPEFSLPKSSYLKHSKDILNRFYFLDIR